MLFLLKMNCQAFIFHYSVDFFGYVVFDEMSKMKAKEMLDEKLEINDVSFVRMKIFLLLPSLFSPLRIFSLKNTFIYINFLVEWRSCFHFPFYFIFFLIFLCSDTWTELEEACGSIYIIFVAILFVVLLCLILYNTLSAILKEKPLRSLWIELSDNTQKNTKEVKACWIGLEW